MRKILVGALLLGAAGAVACDEKPADSTGAAPAASASASAVTSAAAVPVVPEAPKSHASRARAFAEAFAAHDSSKIAALYADDAVIKTRGMPDVKGRAAIAKDSDHLFGVFKDAKLVVGRMWAKDKHTVLVESVFTGTNTGDAPEMGLPKAVGVPSAALVEVGDDGLIKTERRYHDMPTAMGQLVPDPKNPVRPVMAAPVGTDSFEAKGTPDEAKNLDVEKTWVATLNTGKLDDCLKLMAPDAVIEDYTQAAAIKGSKPIKDYLGTFFKAFPDLKGSIVDAYSVGPYAVVRFRYTGTNTGPLGPTKATGKAVDIEQVEVDEIKDGALLRAWSWGNSGEMLSAMGLMAPPAAPSAAPAK